jgi:hypothetical protein
MQFDIERHAERLGLMKAINATFVRLGETVPPVSEIISGADSFDEVDFENRYRMIELCDDMASRLDGVDHQTTEREHGIGSKSRNTKSVKWHRMASRLAASNRRYKLADHAWRALGFWCMACHPQPPSRLKQLLDLGYRELSEIDRLASVESSIADLTGHRR